MTTFSYTDITIPKNYILICKKPRKRTSPPAKRLQSDTRIVFNDIVIRNEIEDTYI